MGILSEAAPLRLNAVLLIGSRAHVPMPAASSGHLTCFTYCMLIRRPAYHINEHAQLCSRSTKSAGPNGPNGTQPKELASVSQNGVVYLVVVRARGLVRLRFPAEPCCPFGYESQSDPGRGQARAGSPRDL